MIVDTKGFVLFEVVSSLTLLLGVSFLLFTWQVAHSKKYQELQEQIQGLCLARSIIAQVSWGQVAQYPQKRWRAQIRQQKDPLLPLRYVIVTLFLNKDYPQPLIMLKTAYAL